MKLSWASVQRHVPSPQKYIKTIFPSVLSMFLKAYVNDTCTICLKIVFRTRDIVRWWFPDSFTIRTLHTSSHCIPMTFYCSLLSELVFIISGRYTFVISVASFLPPWFLYLLKILCMYRWYFFSSQKAHMIIPGETAWDNGLKF